MRSVLLDSGPIVAYLDRDDAHHDWAAKQLESLPAPLLTCEPVVTESMFLLRRVPGGQEAVLNLLRGGALAVPFALSDEVESLSKLIQKYANVPMSVADACLVRMSEVEANSAVCTLDGDLMIYRKNGRQRIPLIAPWVE